LLLLLCLQERVKELNDKFNSELEADRQKFDMLLQEKNEQEVEYEEKLRQVRSHCTVLQKMHMYGDVSMTGQAGHTKQQNTRVLRLADGSCERLNSLQGHITFIVSLCCLVHCVLQAELRHSSQLSALDAQYQSKMMAEVERYQQLLQEKEALNER
jgi:hypothetical protein